MATLFRISILLLVASATTVAQLAAFELDQRSASAAVRAGDDYGKNARDDEGGNDNGGNGNRSDNHNDNQDEESAPPPAPPPPPPPPDRSSLCAPAGQRSTIVTADGRIAVVVFPTQPSDVRITIRTANLGPLPPEPGPRVGQFVFQILAEGCGGGALAALPAEVNLGVHYRERDASGLTEAAFVLARLDLATNQWQPLTKQAADPGARFVSATIAEPGFYSLYQRQGS